MIFPIYEMDKTVILSISSPLDEDNQYSVMINAKMPDGSPVVMSEIADMSCARCSRTDHPENCSHRRDLYPTWKSIPKQETIKYLYGINKMHKFAAESMGHMKPPTGLIISKDKLALFARRDREAEYDMNVSCRALIITCDPNGGGANEMSIVAAAYGEGRCYILGLAAHACRDPDERNDLMIKFLDALETHPWLRFAMRIFLAERNSAMQSGELARIVRKRPRTYCIRQKDDRDFGWWTSSKEHGEWAVSLREKMQSGSVFFMKDWIAMDLDGKTNMFEKKEKMHRQLIEQASRLKEEKEKITKPGQIARSHVSGKTDTNGKIVDGQNDDLAVTLAMNTTIAKKLILRIDVPTVPFDILNLL